MAEPFFTQGEMKRVLAMMQSLNGPINVDWNMCASITGLKDGGVASNQWAKLKARKGLTRSSDGTPTKTTPKKRKLDGADDGEAGTPIPAARKKGRKPKTALEIQCDGGARPEDEHAAIVKSEPDL